MSDEQWATHTVEFAADMPIEMAAAIHRSNALAMARMQLALAERLYLPIIDATDPALKGVEFGLADAPLTPVGGSGLRAPLMVLDDFVFDADDAAFKEVDFGQPADTPLVVPAPGRFQ